MLTNVIRISFTQTNAPKMKPVREWDIFYDFQKATHQSLHSEQITIEVPSSFPLHKQYSSFTLVLAFPFPFFLDLGFAVFLALEFSFSMSAVSDWSFTAEWPLRFIGWGLGCCFMGFAEAAASAALVLDLVDMLVGSKEGFNLRLDIAGSKLHRHCLLSLQGSFCIWAFFKQYWWALSYVAGLDVNLDHVRFR
jgi:hypothetical protein